MEKLGYKFRRLPAGHIGIYTPTGQRVRMPDNRPLNMPSTPSDHRTAENLLASLRQAGVELNGEKPKKKAYPKGRRVADSKVSELRAHVHAMIHDGLTQSDIYRYADRYADANGGYKPKGSQTALSGFVNGGGMTEQTFAWLENAVTMILANGGMIPDRPRVKLGKVEDEREPEKLVGVEHEGESKVAPVHPPRIPKLALETMSWIYREDKDHDAIAALVEAIAELELQADD